MDEVLDQAAAVLRSETAIAVPLQDLHHELRQMLGPRAGDRATLRARIASAPEVFALLGPEPPSWAGSALPPELRARVESALTRAGMPVGPLVLLRTEREESDRAVRPADAAPAPARQQVAQAVRAALVTLARGEAALPTDSATLLCAALAANRLGALLGAPSPSSVGLSGSRRPRRAPPTAPTRSGGGPTTTPSRAPTRGGPTPPSPPPR